MEPQEIAQLLGAAHGEAVQEFVAAGAAVKDPFLKIKASALLEVARTLRDHPSLRCDFLENVTAVDWLKRGVIEVVYHFLSYPLGHGFILKVELERAQPKVASLIPLWDSANWLEREQYDLMGVVFEGHPELRRLLLPEDFEGHPLRKDYVQPAEYRGMRTTRRSPLELLPIFDRHQAAGSVKGPAAGSVKGEVKS
jgi:NADH-quinone oxidoreductase subunit C